MPVKVDIKRKKKGRGAVKVRQRWGVQLLIISLLISSFFLANLKNYQSNNSTSYIKDKIPCTLQTLCSWSNATVISDGHNGTYWNNGDSNWARILVDKNDTVHVVHVC